MTVLIGGRFFKHAKQIHKIKKQKTSHIKSDAVKLRNTWKQIENRDAGNFTSRIQIGARTISSTVFCVSENLPRYPKLNKTLNPNENQNTLCTSASALESQKTDWLNVLMAVYSRLYALPRNTHTICWWIPTSRNNNNKWIQRPEVNLLLQTPTIANALPW